MDYTALFNLLYSTEISEATKDEIINKINAGISESYEVKPIVGTYMELLDTLVFSTASESLIYNIIDETFSQLSEEVINEVSNEWVKKKVGDSLKARQSAVDSANKSVKSGVVGLSQLRRQDQAQQNLDRGKEKAASIMNKVERRKEAAKAENANPYTPKAEAPKKDGALGKLKSAVGKVKSWANNVDKTPDYVGLSRAIGAKANKDNIGAETLRQQTTHKTTGAAKAPKAEETPKAEGTPKAEEIKGNLDSDPVAKSIRRNQEKTAKSRAYRIKQALSKAKGTKLPSGEEPIHMGNERINRINAAKEKAKGTKLLSGDTIELGTSGEGKKTAAKAQKTTVKAQETTEPVQQKLDLKTSKVEEKPEVETDTAQPSKKTSRAKKVVANAISKSEAVKVEQPEADKAAEKAMKEAKKKVADATKSKTKGEKAESEQPEAAGKVEPEAEVPKKRTNKIVINAKGRNIKKTSEEQPTTETPKEVKAEPEQTKATEKEQPVAETPKGKAATSIAKEGTTEKKDNSAEANNKPVKADSSVSSNNDVKRQRAIAKAQEELKQWQSREAEILKKIEDAQKFPEYKSSTREYEDRLKDIRERIKDRQIDLNKLQGESVKEALSDLAVLLLGTNISENCFVEVMEMVAANKANAQKALARDEQSAMAVIDDINKDLQAGKPVDPEKVKDAEEKRKKQEHFEELFKKKFGENG